MSVCDFCGGSPLVEHYPTPDFDMEMPGGVVGKRDEFGACYECASLVAADADLR